MRRSPRPYPLRFALDCGSYRTLRCPRLTLLPILNLTIRKTQALVGLAAGLWGTALGQTPAIPGFDPKALDVQGGQLFGPSGPSFATSDGSLGTRTDLTEQLVIAVSTALAAGKTDDALQRYSEALALTPDSVPALIGRAYAYLRRKDWAHADQDLAHALRAGKPTPELYLARAALHQETNDSAGVVGDFTAAIALAPDRYDLRLARAEAYLRLSQNEKAIADCNEALRIAPDRPEAYLDRAIALKGIHREEEALSDLTQAILIDPTLVPAYAIRGELYGSRGRTQEAIGDFEAARRLRPDDPQPLNDLAWYLAICPDASKRDGKRAVSLATRACELTEWKDGGIIDTLAAACAEVGRFKDAATYQARAVALEKDSPEVAEMKRRLDLYQQKKPYHEAAPDSKTLAWENLRYQVFTTVWQTVNDSYYDTTFGGVDWVAVREKYRPKLDTVTTNAELRALIQAMLAELRRTHFAIIPREGAVFNPSERVRIGTVGSDLAFAEGETAVAAVEKGSPAAKAGLAPGDTITKVNSVELAPIAATLAKAGVPPTRAGLYLNQYVESFLTGAVGTSVALEVQSADGKKKSLKVTCGPNTGEWSEPIGYFPSMPIHVTTEKGADGIDLIKFNVFVPPVMRTLRAFMRTVGPKDGLIIDLRGNGGGVSVMAAGICGLLCHEPFSLGTMHARDGASSLDVYPQAHIFDGPIAVLIDRGSASTSEIFAGGIKDVHRARIFGEPSPGMALPSLFKTLPSGDLLQYAVADVSTPSGVTLEGSGVKPDVLVVRTKKDLAEGKDPVMDAARAWLKEALRQKGAAAP